MKKKKWKVKRFEVDVIEGKLAVVWPVDDDGKIAREKRDIIAVGKDGSLRFKV